MWDTQGSHLLFFSLSLQLFKKVLSKFAWSFFLTWVFPVFSISVGSVLFPFLFRFVFQFGYKTTKSDRYTETPCKIFEVRALTLFFSVVKWFASENKQQTNNRWSCWALGSFPFVMFFPPWTTSLHFFGWMQSVVRLVHLCSILIHKSSTIMCDWIFTVWHFASIQSYSRFVRSSLANQYSL